MDWLLGIIAGWSWVVYIVAFALVFLQSAGLPLPSLTFVMLASGLAAQGGDIGFWPVYVVTIVGGALGGMAGHALGNSGGRAVLDRYGQFLWLTPDRIARGEKLYQKHGDKAVLIGRYLPILPFMGGVLGGVRDIVAAIEKTRGRGGDGETR